MAEGGDEGSPKRSWNRERRENSNQYIPVVSYGKINSEQGGPKRSWDRERKEDSDQLIPVELDGKVRSNLEEAVCNYDSNSSNSAIPTQVFVSRKKGPLSNRNRGLQSICPIGECGKFSKRIKQHVGFMHFPAALREQELITTKLNEERYKALEILAEFILGQTGTPEALMDMINRQEEFPDPNKTLITPFCENGMKSMCIFKGWEIPKQFTVAPLNSTAVLLHWRILAILLNYLSQEERDSFCQLGSKDDLTHQEGGNNEEESVMTFTVAHAECSNIPQDQQEGEVTKEVSGMTFEQVEDSNIQQDYDIPYVIDSHFHADRMRRKLGDYNEKWSIEDLISRASTVEYERTQLIGGVTVYCDPKYYPRVPTTSTIWKVAVGVHPRHAMEFSEADYTNLESLILSPHVHALGEVGLDRTEPEHSWRRQEEVLIDVLRFNSLRKPLVLHVRGSRSDFRAADVHARCRDILKDYCAPAQPIHLHCYTGDLEQARSWVRDFPYCFFGFTAKVKEFRGPQIEALKKVPLDRILLETDSPHLPPFQGLRVNSPVYVGEIAKMIARHVDASAKEILQASVENARELYNF